MVLFSEMFLSELLGKPVMDRLEEPVGKVVDIITLFNEAFPKVTGFVVKSKERGRVVILMGEIDLVGKKLITTTTPKDRLAYSTVKPTDVLLRHDVLDKQIVDTEGARVVRVNDIKIAKMGDTVRIIAVDVSVRGVFRRLGLEWMLDLIRIFVSKKKTEPLIGLNHVEFLKTEAHRQRIVIPHKRIEELHPSDIATIMSEVHSDERMAIFRALSDKAAAESLHELEPKIQAFLLTTIDTKKAVTILEKMPSDEAADVLGDISKEKAFEFLRLMRTKKAIEVRDLMKHEDETAGGLMTTEEIVFPQDVTVDQAIHRLRSLAPGAETIYYLYIVDPDERLAGVLSLRNLIVASADTKLSSIMTKEIITVDPEMKQRQVAEVISKYNLLAVPVIDKDRKLLGIITVDDVIDFILPPLSRRKKQMLG
ncbi:magnesium transporter MgtE N-terminal domain-containing protein [Candidatus Margulisiibacteriota bacterium]